MDDGIEHNGEEVSEQDRSVREAGDGERLSALEDLKKRAAEIPPDKKPGKESEL